LSRKKIALLALAAALMMMMMKKKKRLLLFHKPWQKAISLSPHRPNPNPKSKWVQFPSEYPRPT
jgi:hypothetical protein